MGSKIISGMGNASLDENGKKKDVETHVTELSRANVRNSVVIRCHLRLLFTKKPFCEFRSEVDKKPRTSSVWIPNQCQLKIPKAEFQ